MNKRLKTNFKLDYIKAKVGYDRRRNRGERKEKSTI